MNHTVWAGLLVGVLLASGTVTAQQVQSDPKAPVPITPTQRQQIGLSIQAMGTALWSLEQYLGQCPKTNPPVQCVQYAAQRDTLQKTRENLCKEYYVPSGQYGCP